MPSEYGGFSRHGFWGASAATHSVRDSQTPGRVICEHEFDRPVTHPAGIYVRTALRIAIIRHGFRSKRASCFECNPVADASPSPAIQSGGASH